MDPNTSLKRKVFRPLFLIDCIRQINLRVTRYSLAAARPIYGKKRTPIELNLSLVPEASANGTFIDSQNTRPH